MRIKLAPRVEDIDRGALPGSSAIVIDMLRATSVITTALNNGAERVVPVVDVDEAFRIRDRNRGSTVLGGERKGIRVDGFDAGNSPLEYSRDFIQGKTLVITTSNGTRALNGCGGAADVLAGCMLNGPCVAKKAAGAGGDVYMVCAGTLGHFSLDDFICAGYIIDELLKYNSYQTDDISFLAHYTYVKNSGDIRGFISNASHFNYLVGIGMAEDIEYCCQKGVIDIAPEFRDGSVTVR